MYQIDQKLGQGSFGVVYHLRLHNGSEFALKVAEIGRLKGGTMDASREAKLMLELSHAHLVQCCASFRHGRFIYLVTELCRHGTLKNFLSVRTRLVRETKVLTWLGQMANALRYLHACRVIHRDLKTDNVFLDDRKNIKVGDLGIARELDYTAQKAGTFIGTFCYMSPEILESSAYSFETDIWSLGCCIHEVMTLRQTFTAQSMMEVMDNIMEARIPPMPDVYSKQLKDLVLQMFHKEPLRRPDPLEILFAVSKIQGFPFQPGPYEPLKNIEVDHKMLVNAVQNFEIKSSIQQDTISHRDESTLQHCDSIVGKMIEDMVVGSWMLSGEEHSQVTQQNRGKDVLSDSERKIILESTVKQKEQIQISKTKETSSESCNLKDNDKLSLELSSSSNLFLSDKIIDVVSTSSTLSSVVEHATEDTSHTCSNADSSDDTVANLTQYMDCLAKESQQWLRKKFGLDKRKADELIDDDCENSVTLYTRAQVVKYSNRKNNSRQVKTGNHA